MHEPEEPDESTPPTMQRVFDELEAEFDAGLRREAEQEAVAAVRAELGSTVLWEQLARRIGSDAVVLAGARTFRGAHRRQLPGVPRPAGRRRVRAPDPPRARGLGRPAQRTTYAAAHAEPGHAPVPVRPRPPRAGPAPGAGQGELADGTSCDGTIEAVSSDYLELGEHDLGEARRRLAVRARRFIGFAAVVAVTLPPARR